MGIIINNKIRLCDIQDEFSGHFPFLKLEFFRFAPDCKNNQIRKNIIKDTTLTVDCFSFVHNSGMVSLNGHQKVKTLEDNFQYNYGLNVQVFRKSGPVWLETTSTDDWTLTKQNSKGEEMSLEVEEAITLDYAEYHDQVA